MNSLRPPVVSRNTSASSCRYSLEKSLARLFTLPSISWNSDKNWSPIPPLRANPRETFCSAFAGGLCLVFHGNPKKFLSATCLVCLYCTLIIQRKPWRKLTTFCISWNPILFTPLPPIILSCKSYGEVIPATLWLGSLVRVVGSNGPVILGRHDAVGVAQLGVCTSHSRFVPVVFFRLPRMGTQEGL